MKSRSGEYICANSVQPGVIRMPMVTAASTDDGVSATPLIPLGRLAEPSEVSNLVVFLA
ncbi:SDR family oxidoreductase [Sphingobacterium olei]|nr:SDR family oxidoreductase [Sphingobacterium olei]